MMAADLTKLMEDGENQAVRDFLALYGCAGGISIKQMRDHMRRSGWKGCWPDWVDECDGHLTKAGAQSWLRHLFLLEQDYAINAAKTEAYRNGVHDERLRQREERAAPPAGEMPARMPKLSNELYELYPAMSAQSHEEEVQAYARAYASQLALPAGPVPWRCFHCDETFDTPDAAALHFGTHQMHSPACLINIEEYRAMEKRMESYNQEDADIHREMAGLRSKHAHDLQREEIKGYERGLRDAGYQATRNAVLEEAARMVEDYQAESTPVHFSIVASDIRALKSSPSPAVAQPVVDEREAFQEWIKSKKLLASNPMWLAWQARAALRQPAEEGGRS
ncbi:hypothetical protein ACIPEN_14385 [Herbaspirillum chlorophenolicum]|uniref:C2H2-type domain-containing protein n=1 Tax=Herbaspirillum chlorophenolicum TaxID=211589 RepID=A0ABW8F183_9BURK